MTYVISWTEVRKWNIRVKWTQLPECIVEKFYSESSVLKFGIDPKTLASHRAPWKRLELYSMRNKPRFQKV